MRRTPFLLLAALIVTAFTAAPGADKQPPLPIGSTLPTANVPLTATDGAVHTLAQVAGEGGLLVIFGANTCPFVLAWQDRFAPIAARAAAQGIGTIVVNSNEAFRNDDDSPAAMRAHVRTHGYTVPYVMDNGVQVADAFGATRTPEVFLFDGNRTLVYRGSIDDNARNAADVTQPFLLDAIAALSDGDAPDPQVTRSIGCSIKRIDS
jgi:hypothetical protein